MFFISKEAPQLNGEIRDKEVRVITADGEQLGIMSAREAQQEADKRGQDLVKIAPQAKPPVVKIMDYSKFRYEQAKRSRFLSDFAVVKWHIPKSEQRIWKDLHRHLARM